MRRQIIALACILFISAVAALTFSSRANSVVGIGKFRETNVSHKVSGQGAGSTEVLRGRIYTYSGQFVGTNAATCSFVDEHTSFRQCVTTYLLPLGKIIAIGSFASRAGFEMIILGGTRYYANASGTVVTRRIGDNGGSDSFLTFYITGP
jgi:hypothetical protein